MSILDGWDRREAELEMIECARFAEEADLVEWLEAGLDVNAADDAGNSALHKAAANGHEGIVRLLLGRGAAFRPNASGNTPLHWAAQQGHTAAVRELLAGVPDIDVVAPNGFGRSAVTEAVSREHKDIAALLLAHPSFTVGMERAEAASRKTGSSAAAGGGGGGGGGGGAAAEGEEEEEEEEEGEEGEEEEEEEEEEGEGEEGAAAAGGSDAAATTTSTAEAGPPAASSTESP